MKDFLRGFFAGLLLVLFIFCSYLILSGNAFDREVEYIQPQDENMLHDIIMED